MIYFVRGVDGGPIKIGSTQWLGERLPALENEWSKKLVVLGIMDGNHKGERKIHKKFDHLAMANEWFVDGDDLLEFIRENSRAWTPEDDAPIPPKIVTRSICFDRDVYEAMEAETVKMGYGSQSRLVNHAMRKLLKLKPRPNSYQRQETKS